MEEYDPLAEAEEIIEEELKARKEILQDTEDFAFDLVIEFGMEDTNDIYELLNTLADDSEMSLDERREFFTNTIRRISNEWDIQERVRIFLATHYPEYEHMHPDADRYRRLSPGEDQDDIY